MQLLHSGRKHAPRIAQPFPPSDFVHGNEGLLERHLCRSIAVRAGCLLLLLTALSGIFVRAHGQVATADVLGTATDSTGSTVPGATVVIQNTATQEKRTTLTTSDGAYTFSALQAGPYTLTVTATGFKTFVARGINLAGSDRTRVDSTLALGAVSEQVEVTAKPPRFRPTAPMSARP